MSYYVRFISTSEVPSFEPLRKAIAEHAHLTWDTDDEEGDEGVIIEKDGAVAAVEINRPGQSGLFEEEVQEILEEIEDGTGDQETVRSILKNAKATIAFQVLFGNEGFEDSLAKLDPLFSWLSDTYEGLLQADDEGFYLKRKLILEV